MRKRRFIQGLLILALLCGAVLLAHPSAAWAGTIEPKQPAQDSNGVYQISDAGELYWFAGLVNGDTTVIGNETQQNTAANAVLTDNITINKDVLNSDGTLNGAPTNVWTPISDSSKPYTGTFDGKGHTISGIYIDSNAQNIGLFGYIGEGGAVQDLTLADSYINSSNSSDQYIGSVGGICGNNKGTITSCSNSGSVSSSGAGELFVGGICGNNKGTIISCSNNGRITGSGDIGGICGYNYSSKSGEICITSCSNSGAVTGSGDVGGICGYNSSLKNGEPCITSCSNSGAVTGSGDVGGICGLNEGSTITSCSNSGSVTDSGTGKSFVGGICGTISSNGSIKNCSNNGAVTGSGDVGGICGLNKGSTITSCSNSGSVSGSGDVGGICGLNEGIIITSCSNSGSVSGSGDVGGICGLNKGSTITSCSNTGSVSGSGICGLNDDGSITSCYWLKGTASNGIGDGNEDGATMKTASEYASGEVAWLLNQGLGNNTWRQNLTGDKIDAVPTLDQTHNIVEYKDNKYTNDGHVYQNGFCTCGSYEPATQDEAGTYQIKNAGQLYWFAGLVNGTLTDGTAQNTAANAVLTEDIVLNEKVLNDNGDLNSDGSSFIQWTPIGNEYINHYTGTFDGNNKTISGLYINNSTAQYVGLFGCIITNGSVKNLTLADSYFNNSSYSGGLAYVGGICGGNDGGSITNCINSGTVTGHGNVGGICGYNYSGTITSCSNSDSVSGSGEVGGICGTNGGTVAYCSNSSSVADSSGNVGGICGMSNGSITSCSNSGLVEGRGDDSNIGGICGYSIGTITNCSNSGPVEGSGNDSNIGGICGQNSDAITNCSNSGSVSGSGNVGGICGMSYGSITSCSNSVTVEGRGDDSNVGGICGQNGNAITNCSNIGTVTGSGDVTFVGGICGQNYGSITNCYWLQDTANNGIGGGSGEATEKTVAQYASGEVAWLLNQNQADAPWRQNLGEHDKDAAPTLDSTHKVVVQVTFNANTGNEEDNSYKYANSGDTVSVPEAPGYPGHTFGGWYEDENCTGENVTAITATDADNQVYWAKWTAKSYPSTPVTPEPSEPADSEETVTNADGSTTTTITKEDGSTSTTTVSSDGKVEADVTLSDEAISGSGDNAVALPVPEITASSDRDTAPTVTVHLPENTTTSKVDIPVENVTAGTVAILVHEDGSEEVLKNTVQTENGISVAVSDGDTLKIVDNSKTFDDVSDNHWGAAAIDFATSRELFAGTAENTFSPDSAMTRAMIWSVLARYEGADTTAAEGSAWYAGTQQWAIDNGISDGTNPDDPMTREQFAAMLYRSAGSPAVSGSVEDFGDAASVSSWASDAMIWAVQNGIIGGYEDSTLRPQNTATRTEVAAMLQRFVILNAQ